MEACGLEPDRAHELGPFAGGELVARTCEHVARRHDRGDGRAQVVADRARTAVFAASLPAQRLGLDRLTLPPSLAVRRLARRPCGLLASLLDLLGALACARREGAHAHRRHEIDGERDPVLRVVKRERMRRREEQPVEHEHAHDRDGDREREPEEDGDGQDREHVEDAQTEDWSDRLEQEDRTAHERDGPEAHQRGDKLSESPPTVPSRAHSPSIRPLSGPPSGAA